MPHFGQLPGLGWRISGCIGQVKIVPSAAGEKTSAALPGLASGVDSGNRADEFSSSRLCMWLPFMRGSQKDWQLDSKKKATLSTLSLKRRIIFRNAAVA